MALLPTLSIFGQSSPVSTPKRAKIGLVLEGGGALGYAHIGVLQWLEDHRVPVDYIAGTSIGGLIGGLYAMGETPGDIRKLAHDIDWDKTLAAEVPLPDFSFRRKQDRLDFPNDLNFGLKDGLSLPGGLNSGHEIGLILDRAALNYYDLKTFDELPTPFRCVSMEMISGTQKVFDRGSLAMALRATMSTPAVFSPVHEGSKLYADGGALNNLPVDVAKSIGADIVIAVYLNTGADDPKSFNSLLGSAARSISIMIAANEIRSIQAADILLSADVKGFSTGDFSKSEQILPKGFEAAARKSALLERFSLDEKDWEAYLAARRNRVRRSVPVPTFVAVEGAARPQELQHTEAALSSFKDEPLDPAALEAELDLLRGAGSFDSLSYNFATRNNRPGLAIQAVEKSYAPPYLNLAIDVDGTDTRDIRFGLAGRVTFTNVGGYGSEVRTNAFFGLSSGVDTEYFHPLTGGSHWFVAPRLYANSTIFDVFDNNRRVSEYTLGHRGGEADLGYSISRRAELRIGEATDWQSGHLVIGLPLSPNATHRRQISSLHFRYFGQDDPAVPRKGMILQSDVNHFTNRLEGDQSYTAATAKLTDFIKVSDLGSVFVTASGGTSFGARNLGGDSFTLGGPLVLGAYGRNELLGNQFYLFQAGYLRQLAELNPIFGSRLYVVGLYEVGKMYAPVLPGNPPNPMDFSTILVAKSLLGPIFVGGSIGNAYRARWWFGLGKVF